MESQSVKKPIVMGDESTIVTETDPVYLTNSVTDINPVEFFKEAEVTVIEDDQPLTNEPAIAPAIKGYTVDYGNSIKVVFPDVVSVKEFKEQNPKEDDYLSYLITEGEISGTQIHVYGLKKASVEQRYISNLIVESGNERLPLSSLGTYNASWEKLTAEGENFKMLLLDKLEFNKVNKNSLRSAVQKAARASRLNKQKTNFWLQKTNVAQSYKDAPFVIKVDNVQFRINGTTSDGQAFSRNLRFDL